MSRLKIVLKPIGRGLEVVGFIPAGVEYETNPEPTLAQRLVAAVRRVLEVYP